MSGVKRLVKLKFLSPKPYSIEAPSRTVYWQVLRIWADIARGVLFLNIDLKWLRTKRYCTTVEASTSQKLQALDYVPASVEEMRETINRIWDELPQEWINLRFAE